MGGDVGEAVAAKALHTPAFVVHADEQVAAHRLDGGGEVEQLGAAFPVAGEQDDAADQRVRQAAAVGGGERRASHVDEEGSVFGHGSGNKGLLLG